MSKLNKIKLDVIPIYKNQIYPTADMLWHFHGESYGKGEFMKETMIEDIQRRFSDCNAVIILEKGKVIEVL